VSHPRFAVVAAGGTGGHVLPALAIGRALAARGHDRSTIEFFGSRRGQEAALLAGEGFPYTLLPGRGILRRLDPRALVANLVAVSGLGWAALWTLASMARRRPKIAIAVGGYASVPAGLAAAVLRVPLVVVNVDAVPGRANRLLGRFAAQCAVGFPGTPLPRAVVTGTPVRDDLLAVTRDPASVVAARASLGTAPRKPTVGVFGGSLGARRINEATLDLGERWSRRDDRCIYHVTGRRDWAEIRARVGKDADEGGERIELGDAQGPSRILVPFQADMACLYQAVDVMVCRAGAITVAELTVTGVPSVLVPLPGAPGDHQTANASALVDAGAAVLLPDPACTVDRLIAILDELLDDGDRLAAMAEAARKLGRRDAAARVAEIADRHAS
jgi:UDP-N-acetylglucosamine--N-acetylmuramyl-(pentapeptide) pyrophosphoryl-undecaprenol N-acetylglucosamine transferase